MKRQSPLSGRMIEVAEDGTIPTWVVEWSGQEKRGRKQYLSDERHKRLEELRAKYPRYARPDPEPGDEDKQGWISHRSCCFLHEDEARAEYNWIRGLLVQRGDWEQQKASLVVKEGEREKWDDLFEEPGIYQWEA